MKEHKAEGQTEGKIPVELGPKTLIRASNYCSSSVGSNIWLRVHFQADLSQVGP